MKQVLVIYKCDNGYKCGCCGRELEESEIHDVADGVDVQDFINQHQVETEEYYESDRGISGRFNVIKAYIVTDEFEVEN